MIGRWAGKLYCRKLVRPKESIDKVRKVGSSSAILKYLVQNDLERPWLQQVRDSFTQYGKEAKRKRGGMGPQQRPDRQALALRRCVRDFLRMSFFGDSPHRGGHCLTKLGFLCHSGRPFLMLKMQQHGITTALGTPLMLNERKDVLGSAPSTHGYKSIALMLSWFRPDSRKHC